MMNKNLKTWILEENMRRWENKMGTTLLCESCSRLERRAPMIVFSPWAGDADGGFCAYRRCSKVSGSGFRS